MTKEEFLRAKLEIGDRRGELKKQKAKLQLHLSKIKEDIAFAKRKLDNSGEWSDPEWYAGLHRDRIHLGFLLQKTDSELSDLAHRWQKVHLEADLEKAEQEKSIIPLPTPPTPPPQKWASLEDLRNAI